MRRGYKEGKEVGCRENEAQGRKGSREKRRKYKEI